MLARVRMFGLAFVWLIAPMPTIVWVQDKSKQGKGGTWTRLEWG